MSCLNCEKPLPEGKEFCNKACELEWEEMNKEEVDGSFERFKKSPKGWK